MRTSIKLRNQLFKIFVALMLISLLLIPYACGSLKNINNMYPVNSKWIYYDGVNDSTVVYINHYALGGIYVRDTEIANDTTVVGWANPSTLYPIKK